MSLNHKKSPKRNINLKSSNKSKTQQNNNQNHTHQTSKLINHSKLTTANPNTIITKPNNSIQSPINTIQHIITQNKIPPNNKTNSNPTYKTQATYNNLNKTTNK